MAKEKPVVSLNKMELHMNMSVDYICKSET